MHYSQPKDLEDLRAFCSLVDQERVANMSKAVRYAAAYNKLKRAVPNGNCELKQLVMEVDLDLVSRGMELQQVDGDTAS